MLNENSTAHEVEMQNRNTKLYNDRMNMALYGRTFEDMLMLLEHAVETAKLAMEETKKDGGRNDDGQEI